MTSLSRALSERRRKSARTLGKKIDETLRDLGLREATVKVLVEDKEPPGPRGSTGCGSCSPPTRGKRRRRWRASPRAASSAGSCWRSSGRWRGTDRAPTYVFDEVDTGVGGGTAEVIGRKLKAIAADRQVLAVTHLPQIAAFADHHLRVDKAIAGGRTTCPHHPPGRQAARLGTGPDAGRGQALPRGRGAGRRAAAPGPQRQPPDRCFRVSGYAQSSLRKN